MNQFSWEDFTYKSKNNGNILTASCYASKKRSTSQQKEKNLERPKLIEDDEFSEFSLQRFPDWNQSRIELNQSIKDEVSKDFKSFLNKESYNINLLKFLADVQDISMISKIRLTEKHGLVFKLKIPPQESFQIALKDKSVLEFVTIYNIPNLYCYSRTTSNPIRAFDIHRLKKLANIHNWSNVQAILYLRLFKI